MASPVSGIKVIVDPNIFGYPFFEGTTDANGEVTFENTDEYSTYTVFLTEAAIGRIDAYLPQPAKTYTLYKITNSSSADITISLQTVTSKTLKSGGSVYAYPQKYIITTSDPTFSEWSPSQYFSQPKARTTNFTMPSADISINTSASVTLYIYTADSATINAVDPSTMTVKYSDTPVSGTDITSIGFDGTYIYAGLASGAVYKYNSDLTQVTHSTTLTAQLNAISWNGEYLVAGDANGVAYLLSTSLSLITQIDLSTQTSETLQVSAILWTGTYNYVICGGPNSLSSSYVFLLGKTDLSVVASKNVSGGQ